MTQSRIEQANHVDHVFPWRKIGGHAFVRNIFQSLCAECHGIKTGLERKGIFQHYKNKTILEYKLNDYERALHEEATKANTELHQES